MSSRSETEGLSRSVICFGVSLLIVSSCVACTDFGDSAGDGKVDDDVAAGMAGCNGSVPDILMTCLCESEE